MAVEDNLEDILFASNIPLGTIVQSGELTMTVPEATVPGGGQTDPGRETETIAHGLDYTPFSFILFNPDNASGDIWFPIGTEPSLQSGGYGLDTHSMSVLSWTDDTNLYIRGVNYFSTSQTEDVQIKWYLMTFGDDL